MKIPFSRNNVCLPLINASGDHVTRYRAFKALLDNNREALKAMAVLEQMYHGGSPRGFGPLQPAYESLLEAVTGVIRAFSSLTGRRYEELERLLASIDGAVTDELKAVYVSPSADLVLPFGALRGNLLQAVGAKAANLALIANETGLPVPEGFAITAHAFQRVLEEGGLTGPIARELAALSSDDMAAAGRRCARLQSMIMSADIPADVRNAVAGAYDRLREKAGGGVRLAVRSSAVGEDTEATFAGQYATVLNVGGEDLIDAYKTVISSTYSARAVAYRQRFGLSDGATPMAVACIAMIDARTSGVVYTADPSSGSRARMVVTSLWGLAERLVDGSAPADSFVVEREGLGIVRRDIRRKEYALAAAEGGGTRLDAVAGADREVPSLGDDDIVRLCRYGLRLEAYFGAPQDIEWAVDHSGRLFILQARPLRLPERTDGGRTDDPPGAEILLSRGTVASRGVAVGAAFVVRTREDMEAVTEGSILVARTASPDYARLAGRVRGIITDTGSPAGHLASVAREFGIPLLVDTGDATSVLTHGEAITLWADGARVYRGAVSGMLSEVRPPRRQTFFGSPVHRSFRKILDLISPLTLTDPEAPSFTAGGCRTMHDIVRFTHEGGVRAMFGITDEAREVRSVALSAKIPLSLRLIDLGGGLRAGLTTCNEVTPGDVESVPFRALWQGLTHPGITWEGTMPLDARKLMTLFAAGAAAEVGETLAGTSYAIISDGYMNLSARFGYHFATIDALCGEDDNQNYISLQFAGGAGNYYGRSLRVSFLAGVLQRLGFRASVKGDLIEASLPGHDEASTRDGLDRLGRLLASSRLLDMTIAGPADVARLTEAFFRDEYSFLADKREDRLENFYTHGGYWLRRAEGGRTVCMQDGSRSGLGISSGVAGVASRFMGRALQEFLDNIGAYFYFPLAIAREPEVADAVLRVLVKPVGGNIDRAGGIAFGIRDVSNYFVLRINALEDNVVLFEYLNSRRLQRAAAEATIPSGLWQEVSVRIRGKVVEGFLQGRPVVTYEAPASIRGYVGLWTKADSVTLFDRLTVETADGTRTVPW